MPNRQVEFILSKLSGVQRSGRGWKALCPAHEDVNPSLQIDVEGDRILAHCHAGCTFDLIVLKTGTKSSDWRIPDKTEVAWYNYVDEQGNLLYQKVRYEPKDFRIRKPSGNADKPWTWFLTGVRRVVYRLNELQSAQRVYIPEGEKDCDRLAALGLTATCNDGGASKSGVRPKWKEEHAAFLVTAGVHEAVILPDNDDAGRAHAQAIARTLLPNGIMVKIVPLPDLPEHGDVSDWLDAGHTLEELQALVESTAALEAVAPADVPTMAQVEGAVNLQALEDELDDIEDPWEYLEKVRTSVNSETSENFQRDRAKFAPRWFELVAIRDAVERDLLYDEGARIFKPLTKATIRSEVVARIPADVSAENVLCNTVDPWDDPVGGTEVLDEAVVKIKEYLFTSDEAYDAIALWCAHTWFFDVYEEMCSPYLTFTSPVKRCGKTRAQSIVGLLSRRPLQGSNISEAALYRSVEKFKPTMIIDEADSFFEMSPTMREVLNAGYTKRTAVIVRCEGDDHDPKPFSTWCPKSLALILDKDSRLPDTIQDRSIMIPMQRRVETNDNDRWTRMTPVELQSVSSKFARWAKDHSSEVREDCLNSHWGQSTPLEFLPPARKLSKWALDFHEDVKEAGIPVFPWELRQNERALENWKPLFQLAELAGGDWPKRARRAAVKLSSSEGRPVAEPEGVQLLQDIRSLFYPKEGQPRKAMASQAIVNGLNNMPERPWGEYNQKSKESGITQRQLAFKLKFYETSRGLPIQPRQVWIGNNNQRGYDRDDFENAWSRFLPPPHVQGKIVKRPVQAVLADAEPTPRPLGPLEPA